MRLDRGLMDGEGRGELLVRDPPEVLLGLGMERVEDPRRQVPPALLVAGCGRRGRQVAEEPDDAGREPLDDGLRDVPRLGDAPCRRNVVDRPGPEALVHEQPHEPQRPQGETYGDPLPAGPLDLELRTPLPVRRPVFGYHGDRLSPVTVGGGGSGRKGSPRDHR